MNDWIAKSKAYLTNRRFLISVVISLALLAASIVANYFAAVYATDRASNPVTDIILSNIPVFDVDMVFIFGPVIMWAFVTALLIWKLKWMPFTLKSVSLFVFIRSVFVSLTHIGPFPTQVYVPPVEFLKMFTTGKDLFFSGHTGLPFLLALVFWDNKFLRYFFLAASVFFGVVVLMGHLHYSIDVMSAFFITYTIYILCERFFKKDHALFKDGLPAPRNTA